MIGSIILNDPHALPQETKPIVMFYDKPTHLPTDTKNRDSNSITSDFEYDVEKSLAIVEEIKRSIDKAYSYLEVSKEESTTSDNAFKSAQESLKNDMITQVRDIMDADFKSEFPDINEKPNEFSYTTLISLISQFAENRVIPSYIEPSVDNGFYLLFENAPIRFHLEIYNFGGIGFLAENSEKKSIIENSPLQIDQVTSKIEEILFDK